MCVTEDYHSCQVDCSGGLGQDWAWCGRWGPLVSAPCTQWNPHGRHPPGKENNFTVYHIIIFLRLEFHWFAWFPSKKIQSSCNVNHQTGPILTEIYMHQTLPWQTRWIPCYWPSVICKSLCSKRKNFNWLICFRVEKWCEMQILFFFK